MFNKINIEKFIIESKKIFSRNSYFNYKPIVDGDRISILETSKFGISILATRDNCAFAKKRKLHGNVYYYYPDLSATNYRKKVSITENMFPGLIKGSRILQCMLLPYLRQIRKGVFIKDVRLVIVTDKCQVFHNKPNRSTDCDGVSLFNDDIKFEESAIWDLPNHKYPSCKNDCDLVERYYPFLPKEAYEYYPMLNTDERYVNKFGNGGFGKEYIIHEGGKEIHLSRFYFPIRNELSNSFFHFGGEETDYKMNLIGTYRPNNDGHGVRTVIFATSDGGRNWFCKYEFGDMGEYSFSQGDKDWRTAFGNNIILKNHENEVLSDNETIYMRKRINVIPNEKEKEPNNKFSWLNPIEINTLEWGKTLTVKTKVEHHLETGNIIALTGSVDNKFLNPLLNNEISEQSGGNGVLYKVNVLDSFTVELYEYVASVDNPISCRHIHQINRVKDGWIVGTGEIYPNGWLLYIQMKEADSYAPKSASEPFSIYRLNSSENSVQRTLGAVILDDEETTLIYASDHDTLQREEIKAPINRNLHISRNSTGIYKGKLEDIDSRDKFQLIYEAKEPSYLFKIINGIYVFAGQRGEFAFSTDKGKNWRTYHLNDGLQFYRGTNKSYTIIGDYIFIFK